MTQQARQKTVRVKEEYRMGFLLVIEIVAVFVGFHLQYNVDSIENNIKRMGGFYNE